MRHLLWIGSVGVFLLLACGMTTHDPAGEGDGESPPQAEPPQDLAEPVEDTPDEAGSSQDGGSSHGPGSNNPDPPEEPEEEDRVEQLVTTLELLRHRAGRCQQKLAEPGAPLMPGVGPFFLGDTLSSLDFVRLDSCLRDFPDQDAVVALVDCFLPLYQGAERCWRACPQNAEELCHGPGWAPGMECLDREVLGQIFECVLPPPETTP